MTSAKSLVRPLVAGEPKLGEVPVANNTADDYDAVAKRLWERGIIDLCGALAAADRQIESQAGNGARIEKECR